MANLFLDRYRSGEHEQVWKDLVALGSAVRSPLYYSDAKAVADETMRRARHNIELIVPKLESMGYQFAGPNEGMENFPKIPESGDLFEFASQLKVPEEFKDHFQKTLEQFQTVRQPGYEPRNAMEAMNLQMAKSLEMAQARLKEMRAKTEPLRVAQQAKAEAFRKKYENKPALENPRIFAPAGADAGEELDEFEDDICGPLPISIRSWYEFVGGVNLDGSHQALNPHDDANYGLLLFPFQTAVEASGQGSDEPLTQLMLWGEHGDCFYAEIPAPSADALMNLYGGQSTFVEYLRKTFACGGFPGWSRNQAQVKKELDFLREGLLAL